MVLAGDVQGGNTKIHAAGPENLRCILPALHALHLADDDENVPDGSIENASGSKSSKKKGKPTAKQELPSWVMRGEKAKRKEARKDERRKRRRQSHPTAASGANASTDPEKRTPECSADKIAAPQSPSSASSSSSSSSGAGGGGRVGIALLEDSARPKVDALADKSAGESVQHSAASSPSPDRVKKRRKTEGDSS